MVDATDLSIDLMARASHNDRRVLVRGVVSTLMLLAGEVPMHATVSMVGGGCY